jgi:hypothetical protein
LILHWVFAVVWILATPNTSDGYGFIIGLFIYGQLVVGGKHQHFYELQCLWHISTGFELILIILVFVGCAFFWIRRNYEADTTRSTAFTTGPVVWKPVILKNFYLRVVCALTFIGMNLMVIVQSAQSSGYPPSWLRPVIIFGLLFVASIYWGFIVLIAKTSGESSPLEIRIVRDGMPIANPADLPVLNMAKLEGNSRVVIYKVRCALYLLTAGFEIVEIPELY